MAHVSKPALPAKLTRAGALLATALLLAACGVRGPLEPPPDAPEPPAPQPGELRQPGPQPSNPDRDFILDGLL